MAEICYSLELDVHITVTKLADSPTAEIIPMPAVKRSDAATSANQNGAASLWPSIKSVKRKKRAARSHLGYVVLRDTLKRRSLIRDSKLD